MIRDDAAIVAKFDQLFAITDPRGHSLLVELKHAMLFDNTLRRLEQTLAAPGDALATASPAIHATGLSEAGTSDAGADVIPFTHPGWSVKV
jgi:hypothetical protein